MNHVFLGLAIANTLLLLMAAASGGLGHHFAIPTAAHLALGFFTILFTCLVHCIVFVYFLGTGKSIQTACEEFQLATDLYPRSKQLKFQVFPYALSGALIAIALAMTGAAAGTYLISPVFHFWAAWAVSGWNILCFVVEYRVISTNMGLMAELAECMDRRAEAPQ